MTLFLELPTGVF